MAYVCVCELRNDTYGVWDMTRSLFWDKQQNDQFDIFNKLSC